MNWSCIFKCIDLMTSENKTVTRKLCFWSFSSKILLLALLVYTFKSKSLCIHSVFLFLCCTMYTYNMHSSIHSHVYDSSITYYVCKYCVFRHGLIGFWNKTISHLSHNSNFILVLHGSIYQPLMNSIQCLLIRLTCYYHREAISHHCMHM